MQRRRRPPVAQRRARTGRCRSAAAPIRPCSRAWSAGSPPAWRSASALPYQSAARTRSRRGQVGAAERLQDPALRLPGRRRPGRRPARRGTAPAPGRCGPAAASRSPRLTSAAACCAPQPRRSATSSTSRVQLVALGGHRLAARQPAAAPVPGRRPAAWPGCPARRPPPRQCRAAAQQRGQPATSQPARRPRQRESNRSGAAGPRRPARRAEAAAGSDSSSRTVRSSILARASRTPRDARSAASSAAQQRLAGSRATGTAAAGRPRRSSPVAAHEVVQRALRAAASTGQPGSAEAPCASTVPAGRQHQQPQHPRGGGRQRVVDQAEGPARAPPGAGARGAASPARPRAAATSGAADRHAAARRPATDARAGARASRRPAAARRDGRRVSWTRASAPRGSQLTRVSPTGAREQRDRGGVSSPPSMQGRTSGTPVSGPPDVATTRLPGASGSSARSCSPAARRRAPAAPGAGRPGGPRVAASSAGPRDPAPARFRARRSSARAACSAGTGRAVRGWSSGRRTARPGSPRPRSGRKPQASAVRPDARPPGHQQHPRPSAPRGAEPGAADLREQLGQLPFPPDEVRPAGPAHHRPAVPGRARPSPALPGGCRPGPRRSSAAAGLPGAGRGAGGSEWRDWSVTGHAARLVGPGQPRAHGPPFAARASAS